MRYLNAIGNACVFMTLASCVTRVDYAIGSRTFHDTDKIWKIEELEVVCEKTGNILLQEKGMILIRDEATGDDLCVVDPFCRIPSKLDPGIYTIQYLFDQSRYRGHPERHVQHSKTLLAIRDFRRDMVKDMSKCPRHGVPMVRGWTKGVSVCDCSDVVCEHITRDFPAAGFEFQPCNGYLGISWICPVCRQGLNRYEHEKHDFTECKRRGCQWHDYRS